MSPQCLHVDWRGRQSLVYLHLLLPLPVQPWGWGVNIQGLRQTCCIGSHSIYNCTNAHCRASLAGQTHSLRESGQRDYCRADLRDDLLLRALSSTPFKSLILYFVEDLQYAVFRLPLVVVTAKAKLVTPHL